MDVLFDARMLNRPLSGLERVQLNVMRELALLPEITRLRVVLLHNTETAKPLPDNVERCEVWTTEDILKVLQADDKPDVYHMTWFPDTTPRDLWLPLAAPASVVEVHDAILNRHPEYFGDQQHWKWYNRFIKRIIRNSDRLLVHSKSVTDEIRDDLDGDPSIADVAPLAIDPDFHEQLPEAEVARRCKRLGFPGKFILAVGKDYPHKDHATLFRALARMDESIHLCIAGGKIWHKPGETSDHIIEELGIGDRVRWIQGLDDQDIKALIQGSEAMAFPSLEEGFGLPPIEAMALGTPVVACDAMSIPEVCGDGAWLHPPGDDRALEDYLDRAIAGGEEVDALIARGRKQAAKYSWKRTAELTVECYKNAIAAVKNGTSPRPALSADLQETIAIISDYGQNDAERELVAWQQRCLGAESQLNRAHAHTKKLEELLRDADQAPPPPPQEAPLAPVPGPAPHRPRWSLRRRLNKIREGLRSRRES